MSHIDVKKISDCLCLVRKSVRLISKRFDIILTDFLTENWPVRKKFGVHISEIRHYLTEKSVTIS